VDKVSVGESLKRNEKKLKELKNLESKKLKEFRRNFDEQRHVQHRVIALQRRFKDLRILQKTLNSEIRQARYQIGRVKGLHCPAKQSFPSYYSGEPDRYSCVVKVEDAEYTLQELYDDMCSSCRLSQDRIAKGVLAWKLKGGE